MPLLDELDCRGQVVCHAQAIQNSWEPAPAEAAHCNLLFDFTELASSSCSCCADYAHVVEFLEEQGFVLVTHGIGGVEVGELVCELSVHIVRLVGSFCLHLEHIPQTAADAVILGVVRGLLNGIAADHCRIAVVVVGLVRSKVDFAQELLLVVLKFTHHLGVDSTLGR